ncbi:hypothetical protein EPN87_01470 [archaeon]|nr:MAG: hypothetical protein EPN87_01470 [archaeon]
MYGRDTFIACFTFVAVALLMPLSYADGVQINATRIGTHNVPEASGIAASHNYPGIYWMISDSDNPPILYAVSPNGTAVKNVWVDMTNKSVTNIDWEDLAMDLDNNIWIGDIGDNGGSRSSYVLYKFKEPYPYSGIESLPVTEYRFVYPDGNRNAESMFVWNGIPYIIAKESLAVYKFPELNSSKTVTLQQIATFKESGYTLTGAAIARNGLMLAIINDANDTHWIFERGAYTDIADFFNFPTKQYKIQFPNGGGEGIGFVNGYDIIVTSEAGGMWRVNRDQYENAQPPITSSLIVDSPINTTYSPTENFNTVLLSFSASGATNCWYELDNVRYDSSCSVSTRLTLQPGSHMLLVSANTSTGILNVYREFDFVSFASNFTVISPLNMTYDTTVTIMFDVTNPLNCWYKLNGVNHDLDCTSSTTLSLQPGNYNITIFANTTAGIFKEYREFYVAANPDTNDSIPGPNGPIFVQTTKFTGETTNLASMSQHDLANASLVLHVPGTGKIRFLEPINFTKIIDADNYKLQFEGYDYDVANETTISVNGQNVTSLPVSNTPANNDVYVPITVDITKLVQPGSNTIVFTQNSGYSKIRNFNVTRMGDNIFSSAPAMEPSNTTKTISYTFNANSTYRLNLDAYVSISRYRIEVNSDALPFMNKPARLVFEHVSLDNPMILRDGAPCQGCVLEKYNKTDGFLMYRVPGFSVYTVEETPVPPVQGASGAAVSAGGGGSGMALIITPQVSTTTTTTQTSQMDTDSVLDLDQQTNETLYFPSDNSTSLEASVPIINYYWIILVTISSSVVFVLYLLRSAISKRLLRFAKS